MSRPAISVCIPTWNRARYLQQALDSVFAQSFTDLEIIVCDDGSTDETAAMMARMKEPRVRYIRQQKNLGIARTRNRCLKEASGRYIAWLDSDDAYLPDMLAIQAEVLDRNPDVGLVHGAFHVIDDTGRRLPDWPKPFANDHIEPGLDTFRELCLHNFVNSDTCLVRRECYERLGPYSPRLTRSGEDWEMWLRIALHYDIAYTASPLACYRQHDSSSTASARSSGDRERNERAIIGSIWRIFGGVIPRSAILKKQASAAIAVRCLEAAGERFVAGQLESCFRTTLFGCCCCRALLRHPCSWRLLLAAARGEEFQHYQATKESFQVLADILVGTRYGAHVSKLAATAPDWEEKQRVVAKIVRQVVPPGKRVAAIDKHDPTLFHLSERAGWHFPDHRLAPGGYPCDSGAAIAHLEDLRQRGASYLVLPSPAYWWLDHYDGFRRHLHDSYPRLWSDDDCMIFDLCGPRPLVSRG